MTNPWSRGDHIHFFRHMGGGGGGGRIQFP